MHCGGATAPPGRVFVTSRPEATASDVGVDGSDVLSDLFATRETAESPSDFEQAYGQADEDPFLHDPEPAFRTGPERAQETGFEAGAADVGQDAESPGLAKTLIRSLGGFIWILMLIGFSIARDCGE